MDTKENIQKLKLLNSIIEDFLDQMDMDEGEEYMDEKKSEKKPVEKKEKA